MVASRATGGREPGQVGNQAAISVSPLCAAGSRDRSQLPGRVVVGGSTWVAKPEVHAEVRVTS
jgi:hypothetical protein